MILPQLRQYARLAFPRTKTFARGLFALTALSWLSLITGCTQLPEQRIDKLAKQRSTQSFSLTAGTSAMKVVAELALTTERETLRVYLEGDGSPWINGRVPAQNPSSHALTGLRLMLADPVPGIYLSRPCYGFNTLPSGCEEGAWTSGRYSQAVISAMSAALDQLKVRYQASHLELIGFSGGGTIATILSAQRSDVSKLVTVAANLDHRRWTQHFAYLPLSESLNARDFLPLAAHIERWHHVAEHDQRVPAQVTAEALRADVGSKVVVHPGFDHARHWHKAWAAIVQSMGMTE